jgi:hypothetical protein
MTRILIQSTWVCICSASLIWIRIRIRIEIKKAGSGSALKPMRVHNTGFSSIQQWPQRGLQRPVVAFVVRGRCVVNEALTSCATPLHHAHDRRLRGHRIMCDFAGSCAMPPNHAPGRSKMCDSIELCGRSHRTATKIPFMYSFSGNCAAAQSQFQHSCVCERFFIFPGLVHLFSCSRIDRPIMGM